MLDTETRLRQAFPLNNGKAIPAIGVGCWMGRQGEGAHVTNMVKIALKLGYRHIDTVSRLKKIGAANYGNEVSVGHAIRESGIPRGELFVTTKLASEDHWDPMNALKTSLEKLGLDYVDLYLMHWPMALRGDGSALQPNESPTYIETWHAMQEVLKTGRTRAIGVSNLSLRLLSDLLEHPKTTVVPAVNQVEAHPCLPQHELLGFCDTNGIVFTAYSPVGKYKFADDKDVQNIASRLGITPAQVILSWGIQRGTAVVPKSVNEERLSQNLSVVELSPDDTLVLDRLHLKQGMHKSVCGFHSPELGGSCFGWTYDQLGWNFGSGGIVNQ